MGSLLLTGCVGLHEAKTETGAGVHVCLICAGGAVWHETDTKVHGKPTEKTTHVE